METCRATGHWEAEDGGEWSRPRVFQAAGLSSQLPSLSQLWRACASCFGNHSFEVIFFPKSCTQNVWVHFLIITKHNGITGHHSLCPVITIIQYCSVASSVCLPSPRSNWYTSADLIIKMILVQATFHWVVLQIVDSGHPQYIRNLLDLKTWDYWSYLSFRPSLIAWKAMKWLVPRGSHYSPLANDIH